MMLLHWPPALPAHAFDSAPSAGLEGGYRAFYGALVLGASGWNAGAGRVWVYDQ